MLDQVQTSKSSSHLRDEVVKPAHRFVANPEKSRYGLVAVLLAFSVAIRFYQLGALNLWCDEDITALAVKGTLQNGFPQLPSGVIYFRSLLTTYLSSLSVAIFGMSEMALRLPSVLFSLGTILSIYALGKLLFSERVALLAAAILSFSAWDIEFARHARMYAALAFFFTFSLYAIFRGVVLGERRWLRWSVVLSVLTLLAHILGVVLALVYFGLALMLRQQKARIWQLAGMSVIIMIAAAALFVLIEFGFSNPDQHFLAAYVQKFQAIYNYFSPESVSGVRLQHTVAGLVVMFSFGTVQMVRKKLLRMAHLAWGVPIAILGLLAMGHALAALLFWGMVALVMQSRGKQTLGKMMQLSAIALVLATVVRAGLVLEDVFAQSAASSAMTERVWQAAKIMAGFPKLYILGFYKAFPLMTVVVVVGLVALYRKANRASAEANYRFAFIAFVLPLLANGVILNDYVEYRLNFYLNPLFALLFAFAVFEANALIRLKLANMASGRSIQRAAIVLQVAAVAMLCEQAYPAAILQTITRNYGDTIEQATAPGSHLQRMPDHIGAAQFVQAHNSPGDILVVNDWLAQSVHFEKIDFWLRTKAFQHQAFASMPAGKLYDIYTGTELLTSVESLQQILAQPGDHDVWMIISLPFISKNLHLSDDVLAFLSQSEQNVVYRARDGVSKVYHFRKNDVSATYVP